MHPKLVNQVKCAHRHHHLCRDADKEQRRVKNPTKEEPGACLTQRSREVVVFTLVMNHVRSPKKLHLVARSMRTVVTKVIEDEGKQPRLPALGSPCREGCYRGQSSINSATHSKRNKPTRLRQATQCKTADGISKPVGISPAPSSPRPLDHNRQEKKGNS